MKITESHYFLNTLSIFCFGYTSITIFKSNFKVYLTISFQKKNLKDLFL